MGKGFAGGRVALPDKQSELVVSILILQLAVFSDLGDVPVLFPQT